MRSSASAKRAPGELRESHIATLLQRRLKFVARRLWLGEALMGGVKIDTLSQIADLQTLNGAIEVTLKTNRNLRELEQALAPVLPFAS